MSKIKSVLFYYICEGEVMSLSNFSNIPSNMNIASSPISSGSTGSMNLPAKNIVVNPPQYFYTFSVRDAARLDTDLSRNFMNMLVRPMDKLPKQRNKKSGQNWLFGTAVAGGGLALWCKRRNFVPYVTKMIDWLKTKIPYLQGKI